MFKWLKKYSVRNDILFLLMGFFVFSSLSSTIMQDYLNFPISMPELLLIPFLFLLRKKITTIRFERTHIVITIFILFILFVLGLLYDEFPIYGMLSSTRSWFYLFVCLFAFSRPNQITNNDLMWLSLGSIIAWLMDSLMNYQKVIASAAVDEQYVTYGLLLAVPVFISLTINRSYYLLALIGFLIVASTGVFAGIRRLLVVLLLSILTTIIFSLIRKKKRIFAYTIFFILGSSIIVSTLPMIKEYVYQTSPMMYYRVFQRTENFLETGDSGSVGDESRQNHLNNFFENLEEYILPRGMVSPKNKRGQTTGKFNDYPIYQLSWIFGWPIAFLILIYVFIVLLRNLKKYFKRNDEVAFVSVNCIMVMFMLLFLEGTYIEYPYATPITGVLLGRAMLNSRCSNIIT